MNEQKNNGRGIFYGVIGVATLVVAIIGATFAYFTATAGNNVITGNMASVSLSLDVSKVTTVDETKGGMIPMSNNMINAALDNDKNQVCVDDNGNAVCQIYKITITNDSSAAQFVDGYVALRGGSGIEPTDVKGMTGVISSTGGEAGTYAYTGNALKDAAGNTYGGTTMRWVQVWNEGDDVATSGTLTGKGFVTAGDMVLGTSTEKVALALTKNDETEKTLEATHNRANIRTNFTNMAVKDTDLDGKCSSEETEAGCVVNDAKGVLTPLPISGNTYDVIGTNFIRTSNHDWTEGKQNYKRANDVTSALVFNQSLAPNIGEATYYIVVWLSETGTDQTAEAELGTYKNPNAIDFFMGNVTFISAQGSEVSATFSSYARVETVTTEPGTGA